jgi:hypothetical protein
MFSCVREGFSIINITKSTCIIIGKEIRIISRIMFRLRCCLSAVTHNGKGGWWELDVMILFRWAASAQYRSSTSSGIGSVPPTPLITFEEPDFLAWSMAFGFKKRRRSCFELKCMSSGRRLRDLLFHWVLGRLILAPPVVKRTSSSTSSAPKKSISNTSFSFLVFLTSATPGAAAIVTSQSWDGKRYLS